ncbi:ATP-dependent Clp protease adapter ClpS [Demequina sp. SYSU T00192]|uniref:ATP-dependent Clp protease adapter ClpS n=1 Tax=Demequina litoralis TaxID=3051660 RepID=A0ABT8GC81_9MICO|nr:ATP-dependent Clp protease adapter ClpS [Demequina sp. SYSU T00192]MDN4476667.1 ATP-dependent Clp protease adapter ClpS [Demequina sp. SYSU T00192]
MGTQERLDTQAGVGTRASEPWVTIVWNDPVNLMSYVTRVFQEYFHLPRHEAEARMREVHENGRSILSAGSREQMEVHVQAMHSYGLWATLERSGK